MMITLTAHPNIGRYYSIYRGAQLNALDPDLKIVIGGSTTFKDG